METQNKPTRQDLENQFIDKIIGLLETEPQNFNPKWYDGKSTENSLKHEAKGILVMKSGKILKPFEPEMTLEQKEKVSQLVEPILFESGNENLEKLIAEL